jgi:FMN phosphatase YigB (HAD superfamily)
MRISFDVDDTLVCGPVVPSERLVPWWQRWRYGEAIRCGTRTLMSELAARRHELWIYTTSFRSPRYLRGWFRAFGIELTGVVNQTRHDRVVGRQGPSKLPPAFGIDLHVDDSVGVAEEGRRHGFEVIVVSPEDRQWTARVLEAVEARSSPTLRCSGPACRRAADLGR